MEASKRDTSTCTSSLVDEPTKPVVGVRTTLICNSDSINRLQYERQTSSASSSSLTSTNHPRRIVPQDPWSETNLQEAIDLWKLTDDEIVRLKQLQHNLKDCAHHFKYDPHIVLRFMTSPVGHHAESLFRKMVQWRIDENIDNMLDEYKPPKILLDYNTTAILKDYDHEGDPIYVERGGAIDVHGMLKRFTREDLLEYTVYTRELNTQGAWLEEYEQRQGRKVKDVTVVYDLKGLNSHHLNPTVMNFFGEIMTLNQEKFPGPIKRMIIIRAPAIFRLAWNVVKHFFPQSARDKMIFAGKHYQKVLEKYMDLDVLPPCIWEGGKGEAATGLPSNLEGGIIPDHVQRESQDLPPSSPSTKTIQMSDSFDMTDQGSFSSHGCDIDTSF